jgi:hypothetical protein
MCSEYAIGECGFVSSGESHFRNPAVHTFESIYERKERKESKSDNEKQKYAIFFRIVLEVTVRSEFAYEGEEV